MQRDHQTVERLADGSINYAVYRRRAAAIRRADLNRVPGQLAGWSARCLRLALVAIRRLSARVMPFWAVFPAPERSPPSRSYRD